MTDFERLKYYWEKGWAKEPQMRKYVQYNVITPEEFEQITGTQYEISQ